MVASETHALAHASNNNIGDSEADGSIDGIGLGVAFGIGLFVDGAHSREIVFPMETISAKNSDNTIGAEGGISAKPKPLHVHGDANTSVLAEMELLGLDVGLHSRFRPRSTLRPRYKESGLPGLSLPRSSPEKFSSFGCLRGSYGLPF